MNKQTQPIQRPQRTLEGQLYDTLEALFALQALVRVQAPHHSATVTRATKAVDSIAVLY